MSGQGARQFPTRPDLEPSAPDLGTTSCAPNPPPTRQVEERVEDVEALQVIPLNELVGVEASDLCPEKEVGWGQPVPPPQCLLEACPGSGHPFQPPLIPSVLSLPCGPVSFLPPSLCPPPRWAVLPSWPATLPAPFVPYSERKVKPWGPSSTFPWAFTFSRFP